MKKEEKYKYRSLDRTKFSLAVQVLIFSILATLLTAFVSGVILNRNAKKSVDSEREKLADKITMDMVSTVKGYPAYEWLFAYWYEHRDELDVEYELTDVTRN